MDRKLLPVGYDAFDEVIENNCYYVDKTYFIAALMDNLGKVNLFTRPRRFGKSLSMSMLQCFFEVGRNRSLFDGLRISDCRAFCEEHQNQYPVISISLKDTDGKDFTEAVENLKDIIAVEANRLSSVLAESLRLDEEDKEMLKTLRKGNKMTDADLRRSIFNLSWILTKHYGRKVIILIDEYDVPLQKAYLGGYYSDMIKLLGTMLSSALKSNSNLEFAVLTGCLRVAHESIFTGLNNISVHTITDDSFDEYFGFTDNEVRAILEYYGASGKYCEVKEWYDGYRFGSEEVYCPWDVVNFAARIRVNSTSIPESFWINSSGNDIVRRLIDKADENARTDIETLVNGGTIDKRVREELTYIELDSRFDNIWSVLFSTGYLTFTARKDKVYTLRIPNREVLGIFEDTIMEWFDASIHGKGKAFSEALMGGDAAGARRILMELLSSAISIRDTASKAPKENFYHGLLLGLLGADGTLDVKSNAEAGSGYADIIIQNETRDKGAIIEVKYSARINDLEKDTEKAICQIDDKGYGQYLEENGIHSYMRIGIAFCRKQCSVRVSGNQT